MITEQQLIQEIANSKCQAHVVKNGDDYPVETLADPFNGVTQLNPAQRVIFTTAFNWSTSSDPTDPFKTIENTDARDPDMFWYRGFRLKIDRSAFRSGKNAQMDPAVNLNVWTYTKAWEKQLCTLYINALENATLTREDFCNLHNYGVNKLVMKQKSVHYGGGLTSWKTVDLGWGIEEYPAYDWSYVKLVRDYYAEMSQLYPEQENRRKKVMDKYAQQDWRGKTLSFFGMPPARLILKENGFCVGVRMSNGKTYNPHAIAEVAEHYKKFRLR